MLNHFRIIALAVYRYLMNSFLSIYEFTIQLSGQHPKILCSETKLFLSLQEKRSAFLANKFSNVWMDRWHLFGSMFSLWWALLQCLPPSELSAPSQILQGWTSPPPYSAAHTSLSPVIFSQFCDLPSAHSWPPTLRTSDVP